MYSIENIIKRSFLEGFTARDINLKTVIIVLLLTSIISLYIFVLYRFMCRKTFYSRNFNISLVGVALITAAIIVTIQSSIVVSLGMVGALSIVRFRTAVKDPMDLMFLFWSISTGIICGAGFAEYAVMLAFFLTIIVILLNYMPTAKASMILIINAERNMEENEIIDLIKKHSSSCCIKTRNITQSSTDYTIEVRTKCGGVLVKEIMRIDGVKSASLLSHDGEVTF